ncbi:tRNA N6-adenosine threonylcarbamoyltransferase, mitochondrial [Trichomonascus vanleenenianus]|uniref:putative N(6)-L-threonylcarbamoyladenine synthase n=1 Tax=Trichomonascus vanleenenianus TaxID=2268995 RepID=UPI003ECB0FC1
MFRQGIRRAGSIRRNYHVLAIETSCDDSSVALIRRVPNGPPVLIDHQTETLDTVEAGGIIPTDAKSHHQSHLAPLVQRMLQTNQFRPELICATRGPGMMGSLSAGFNFAKGLSVAWDVPLVGVHHMVGHLLTPRFFSNGQTPKFPFVSLLASGGHTMLVYSKSVTEHKVLANTVDIAVGDMLDKCGRELGVRGNMIGKHLEQFVNSGPPGETHSIPEELEFPNPLQNQKGRVDFPAFSFAPFISALRIAAAKYFDGNLLALPEGDRRELGRRIQRAILYHLVSKVKVALVKADIDPSTTDFVLSGGVASNSLLRSLLEEHLDDWFAFHFPDPKWCTDNALMIGWAGIELFESAKLETDLAALNIAKWPIDELLDVDCWIKH